MKKLILYAFINAFFLTLCFGQQKAFTFESSLNSPNVDQSKIITYATNLPRIGNLRFISWDKSKLPNNDDKVVIQLPELNSGQTIEFNVLDVISEEAGRFQLIASSSLGDLTVYATEVGIGGTIEIPGHSYSLFPLGDTKSVIIENNLQNQVNPACGSNSTSDQILEPQCTGDCGSAVLDVLVLITPAASTFVTTTFGGLGSWFLYSELNNMNGALVRSGIPGKRIRVMSRTFTPSFALTTNIFTDRDNIAADPTAKGLMLSTGSDITVLLTNQGYLGPNFGVVNSFDPGFGNKFCIVEVPFLVTRFTMAHEIAHHFDCHHSDEHDGSTLICQTD